MIQALALAGVALLCGYVGGRVHSWFLELLWRDAVSFEPTPPCACPDCEARRRHG